MRLAADLRSVYRHMSIRRRRWLRCQRGCAYQDRPPRLTTVEAGSGVRQAPMTSARCTPCGHRSNAADPARCGTTSPGLAPPTPKSADRT